MTVSRRGQKTIAEERTVERRRKCKLFVHKRIALPPSGGVGDGREGGLNDSSQSQILEIVGLYLFPASRCTSSINFSVIYSVLLVYSVVCSALLFSASLCILSLDCTVSYWGHLYHAARVLLLRVAKYSVAQRHITSHHLHYVTSWSTLCCTVL